MPLGDRETLRMSLLLEFSEQPGPGESPEALRRRQGYIQLLGCSLLRQSHKEAKLHHLSRPRVDTGQSVQGLIQSEES